MADSKRVADALNSLSESTIRGHVDEGQLHELINDYFGTSDDVQCKSDSEDCSMDGESTWAVENNGSSASEADASDDGLPDDNFVKVDEVCSVLGTSANKPPDVVCESIDEEIQRIRNFTCHCQHYKNGPCYSQFSSETVLNHRSEIKSLTEGK